MNLTGPLLLRAPGPSQTSIKTAFSKNLLHVTYLRVRLEDVRLVDAYRINPHKPSLVDSPKMAKELRANVWWYKKNHCSIELIGLDRCHPRCMKGLRIQGQRSWNMKNVIFQMVPISTR